jgi:hypothetical protein
MLKFSSRWIRMAFVLTLLLAGSSAFAANRLRSGSHVAHHRNARRQGRKHKHASRHRRRVIVARTRSGAALASAGTILIGSEAVYGNRDSLAAGTAEAFPFTASASGSATSIHVYVDTGSSATKVVVGLYQNSSGHPSTLLSTGSLRSPQSGAWNSVPIGSVAVSQGARYWLAVLGVGGTLRYRDLVPATCQAAMSAQSNLTALASEWRSERLWWTCPISAYVEGSATQGGEEPTEPPANTTPPSVSGAAVQGTALAAQPGSWSGSPTSYGYQWQDCTTASSCASISGATRSSYMLASGDVGHSVRVMVTASNAGGSASAASPVTATVSPQAPVNTGAPTITGVTEAGHTLQATVGSWSNEPSSYAYQWQACNAAGEGCMSVAGATGSSYALGSGDVGHTLRVWVLASNAGGSASAVSAVSGIVGTTQPAPVSTAAPAVSGVAEEGQVLQASPGSWSNNPTSFAYQWQVCGPLGASCTNVAGATGSSYTLSSGDVGHTLRVLVTASNAGGSASAASAISGVVVADPSAPINVGVPTISGVAEERQTLRAGVGSWSNGPTSYGYQWQQCSASGGGCANISGASGSSYTLGSGDVGHTVRVLVTASNAAGSASAASVVSAVVAVVSEVTCGATVSASASASTVASTIAGAADGSTVCLEPGEYSGVTLNHAEHSGYVTVRPKGGAHVVVSNWEVLNSSYLRFEKLESTGMGFRVRDLANHLQWLGNRFTGYRGLVIGNSNPAENVLIEGNTFEKLKIANESCSAIPGVGEGQGVTLEWAHGVTVRRNRFKEVIWHYIQGGENTTVEENLFEGPMVGQRAECTHLNVWQIFDGSSNDTFSRNIVRGEPGRPAAVTPILFEHGVPSKEGPYPCTERYANLRFENNLFVYASTAYVVQVYNTEHLVYSYNTTVGGEYGTWLDRSDPCGAGTELSAEHNLAVQTQSAGAPARYVLGECAGSCSFEYNVSDDATANQGGATHYLISWLPVWTTASWNPSTEPHAPPGYYKPTGLPFQAGYQGNTGP